MRIIITKDFKDPRPNRNKKWQKGLEITVSNEIGKELIKDGKAKEFEPVARPIIKTAEKADEYEENYNEDKN